jgi:hypothetical protein
MKKRNILPAGLLAAAALASLAGGAQAANVTSSPGDLFLGFNEPGVSSDYVVDLGPASYFISLASRPGTTDITTSDYSGAGLGNIANDLSTVFGTSWYANNATQGTNVQWGIAGATATSIGTPIFGLPVDTLFFTAGELTPGLGSTGPEAFTANAQNASASKILNQFQTIVFDNLADTSNSTVATIEPSTQSDIWGDYNVQSTAFGTDDNIEQPTSGTYIGPTNSQLDLYELVPTNDGGSANGTELGSFSLTTTGQLDFTSAAVPEPSTYATVGLGIGLLLLVRRNTRKVIPG